MELTELHFIVLAGLFLTLTLSLFDRVARSMGFLCLSLTRIIGSFFTSSGKKPSFSTWCIHLFSGLFFAFLYAFVLKGIPNLSQYTLEYLFAGALLGSLHGLVFTFLFYALFTEKSSLRKYKKFGFRVGFFHFCGHVIYGLSFGFFYMLMMGLQ